MYNSAVKVCPLGEATVQGRQVLFRVTELAAAAVKEAVTPFVNCHKAPEAVEPWAVQLSFDVGSHVALTALHRAVEFLRPPCANDGGTIGYLDLSRPSLAAVVIGAVNPALWISGDVEASAGTHCQQEPTIPCR